MNQIVKLSLTLIAMGFLAASASAETCTLSAKAYAYGYGSERSDRLPTNTKLETSDAYGCFKAGIELAKRLGAHDYGIRENCLAGTCAPPTVVEFDVTVRWKFNDGFFSDTQGLVSSRTNSTGTFDMMIENGALERQPDLFVGDRRFWD